MCGSAAKWSGTGIRELFRTKKCRITIYPTPFCCATASLSFWSFFCIEQISKGDLEISPIPVPLLHLNYISARGRRVVLSRARQFTQPRPVAIDQNAENKCSGWWNPQSPLRAYCSCSHACPAHCCTSKP